MANTSPKYQFQPMSVEIDGSLVLVERMMPVDEVPISAMPIMRSISDRPGAAEMFAALPIKKLPLLPEFPVYVTVDDEAYLMPMETALRHGQWEDHPDGLTQDEIDDLTAQKG